MEERIRSLAPRQAECLRLVAQLKDTQQIAHLLGLSPHTVDSYIRDAVRHLKTTNRREAATLLRAWEQQHPPPEKIGCEIPRVDEEHADAPVTLAQSDGETGGATIAATAVREMPKAYETLSAEPRRLSWSPLPGEDRRPNSVPPLRRLVLIVLLVLGIGAGVGITVLTVAGAIAVAERSRL